MLEKEKQQLVEILVDQKAEEQEPETADGQSNQDATLNQAAVV